MTDLFTLATFLADRVPVAVDLRPPRLRSLRDAEHPTCPYYRFLFELSMSAAPLDVIEVGTFVGTSAAHLAAGGGQVITIDINPDAKLQVDRLGLKNIEAITADSAAAVEATRAVVTDPDGRFGGRRFDIAYIDGLHNFNQTYGEYVLYRELVRDGGLLIFDDVGLEMAGDEMNVFWDFVVEPKIRVDHLHTTGFGIVRKVDAVAVPLWQDVIDVASREIARRAAAT